MSLTLGNINAIQFLPDKFKTFFYENQNVIYLIECQESISNSITEHHENVLVFSHQYPAESGIMYQLTCRKLPNIFISQLLNKTYLNIEFDKFPQLEFSEKDKEILKSNLKKELANYLELNSKQHCSYSSFIQLYNFYDTLSSLKSDANHGDNLNQEISNETEENLMEKPLCIEENETLVTLQSPPRIEPFSENESSIGKKPPCNWTSDAEQDLVFYLKEKKVDQDQRIGKMFWIDASAYLQKNGFKYSADQCKVKWKNIKQIHKKNNSYPEVGGKRKIDSGLFVDECRHKKIIKVSSNDIDEVTFSEEDTKVYTFIPEKPKI